MRWRTQSRPFRPHSTPTRIPPGRDGSSRDLLRAYPRYPSPPCMSATDHPIPLPLHLPGRAIHLCPEEALHRASTGRNAEHVYRGRKKDCSSLSGGRGVHNEPEGADRWAAASTRGLHREGRELAGTKAYPASPRRLEERMKAPGEAERSSWGSGGLASGEEVDVEQVSRPPAEHKEAWQARQEEVTYGAASPGPSRTGIISGTGRPCPAGCQRSFSTRFSTERDHAVRRVYQRAGESQR